MASQAIDHLLFLAIVKHTLVLVSDRMLVDNMQSWPSLSPFAAQEKLAS